VRLPETDKVKARPSVTCGYAPPCLAAVCRLNPPFRSTLLAAPASAAFSQVSRGEGNFEDLPEAPCDINRGG